MFRFDQPTSNANLASTFERILFMSLFRNITIFLHHSTRSSPELATPETRRSNSSPGTFVTNPMEIFTGRGKSVKWKSTSARGQVAGGWATWKTTQRRFPRPFEIGLIKTHRLLIRTLSLFVILKTNSIIPAGSPNFFFFFSPLFAAGCIPSRPVVDPRRREINLGTVVRPTLQNYFPSKQVSKKLGKLLKYYI